MNGASSRRGLFGLFAGATLGAAAVGTAAPAVAEPAPKSSKMFTGPDADILLYCDIHRGFLQRQEMLQRQTPPDPKQIDNCWDGIFAAADLALETPAVTVEGRAAQEKVREWLDSDT